MLRPEESSSSGLIIFKFLNLCSRLGERTVWTNKIKKQKKQNRLVWKFSYPTTDLKLQQKTDITIIFAQYKLQMKRTIIIIMPGKMKSFMLWRVASHRGQIIRVLVSSLSLLHVRPPFGGQIFFNSLLFHLWKCKRKSPKLRGQTSVRLGKLVFNTHKYNFCTNWQCICGKQPICAMFWLVIW